MIKKVIIYTVISHCFMLLTTSSYASLGFLKLFIAEKHENCVKALPTHHKNFCASFKSVAECHCTSSGLPKSMCGDMSSLYERMISVFDTQLKACEYQKDTRTQNCMASWNCYRLGGKDALGRLCGSTGRACVTRGGKPVA